MAGEAVPSADRANWAWLSVVPMGLGAWAPIYAGIRARHRGWIALGIVWSVIAVAGWAVAVASHGGGAGGGLIILGWVGAIATSFAIRAPYLARTSSAFDDAVKGAEQQLRDRRRARDIAHTDPSLARQLGVGRPDLPGARDAGLIDVNNAPASVLTRLPGVDDALATRIVEARASTNGFTSIEDLGVALDLDGNLVESLRELAVFLPR